MTGKETLDDYKDFGKIKGESITSNQTFVPSRYHNEWRQKYFEEIEDVNLRADMVCARNDELENKLSKYEKAFEILKKMKGINRAFFMSAICDIATNEEQELLEELMKNETENRN